jgi:hypothetical protein
MATTSSYVSVKRVIERVYSDYGLPKVFEDEVKEWVFDALSLISIEEILYDDIQDVEIISGRGRLPRNFFRLNPAGVREKSSKVHLVHKSGSFNKPTSSAFPTTIVTTEGSSVVYDIDGNIVTEDAVNVVSVLSSSEDIARYEYRIKDGWIFTSLSDTMLEISCKAIIMDDDGSPMVPDDTKIINAAVASVAYKIAKRLIIVDQISDKAYKIIEEDYLFNIASARSGSKVPSPDKMESFKNRFLRLIPDVSAFTTGFSDTNIPEQLNNEFN